jgi:hypothetical protein
MVFMMIRKQINRHSLHLLLRGKESILKSQHAATCVSVRFLSSKDTDDQDSNGLYLHVGPSGDCWTGHSIFAAKHLQPDYVKSLKLQPEVCVDTLLELLEENDTWSKQIYDEERFPDDLMECLEKETK